MFLQSRYDSNQSPSNDDTNPEMTETKNGFAMVPPKRTKADNIREMITRKIASMVEDHPNIWCQTHEFYNEKDSREASFDKILLGLEAEFSESHLNEAGIRSSNDVKTKWKYLSDQFSRALRKRAERLRAGEKVVVMPKFVVSLITIQYSLLIHFFLNSWPCIFRIL